MGKFIAQLDVTNQLIGNLVEFTNSSNLFDTLALSSPLIGLYRIVFNNSDLLPLSLNFTVVAGPANKLVSTSIIPPLRTSSLVSLGDIEVCVRDEVNNLAFSSSTVFLSINSPQGNPVSFFGNTQRTLNGACVTFLNTSLSSPSVGRYTIELSSSLVSIQSTELQFDIREGDPSSLIALALPPAFYDNTGPFPIQPSFNLRDAAGNLITEFSQIFVRVIVLPVNNTGIATVSEPSRVLVSNGRASWNSLQIRGASFFSIFIFPKL